MSAEWKIGASQLCSLRGMIIDRDAAWRADPEWAPIIDAAIRAGIENIDGPTFGRIFAQLWGGGYRGDYTTYGMGEVRMAKAWRRYLKKHRVQPADT
ncbi:hypothetical protein [Mycolicibacterium alvei]|uniref:Uncharacterized protein n=1 Tax=Mycolicibacterium alvei TaxID=67081 RepID=A0A6N4UVV5_9MYCO|nr:hypothetical protein [Mycolicibacterium alvei]MCV7002107.1 hypothetical protein [Mycolicibacterium alvei]BBX27953.1 hypothetical protein MALV_30780 [Mycolicibacterium alvei]